jgi:prophage regulatory protein
MPDRIIREPERRRKTGISRAWWYELEARGEVPPRRQLSARATGWWESEIDAWIASRPVVARLAKEKK